MDTTTSHLTRSSALSHSALKTLSGLLLLLPLVVVPLVALWYAGPEVLTEHAVLDRYRPTSAVVVSAAVVRNGTGATSYVPRVHFSYAVGGRSYVGDRVTPRDVPGTLRWARKRASGYRPGERVTAFYDPLAPGEAFLQRRGTPALTATFFLPVPLLALLFWLAANARAQRARRDPPAELTPAAEAAD